MAPDLSLSYSSHAGNGIVGTSWSLDGLPSVTRCPQTIAQDGVTGTVNFTANDRFCLHGQRLVAINGGAYGADGTEYRTEVDGFSRIVSHGTQGNGPAWFQVWTKAGQVMQFGDTVQVLASGTSTVRNWPVDRIGDAVGNYLTVSYQQTTSTGEVYPTRVDYTFNTAKNLASYNSVQFSYSSRSDVVTQYQAGSSVQTSQILTNIRTYNGSNLVFDYKLTYQSGGDSARSRLNMLTICQGTDTYCQSNSTQSCQNSDASCIPSTVFTYNDGDAQLTSVGAVSTQSGSLSGYKAYFGDFGGAGRQSVLWDQENGGVSQGNTTIWLSNGSGGFTVATNQPTGLSGYLPFIADFNGDGKADILWYNPTTYQRVLWVSNGDGSFSVTTNVGGLDGIDFGTPLVADFNGDGLADVLWCKLFGGATLAPRIQPEPGGPPNSFPQSYCNSWINTGVGSFSSSGRFTTAEADWTGAAGYVPLVGNFSGTARADIFWAPAGSYANPVIWYAGNGYASTGNVLPALWDTVAGMTPVVGNFGSDSNSGILWYAADTNGISTSGAGVVWVGQGTGNFTAVSVTVPTGSVPLLGDFDGDGRTDILWDSESAGGLTTGTRVLWLGNGDGTFRVASNNPAGENGIMDASGGTGWHPYVTDVIGVGKASVLWDNIDSQQRSLGNRRFWQADNSPPPDTISTLTNGIGSQIQIGYSSLANYGFYSKGSSAQYPTLDFAGALWVVSSSSGSNGIGGTNTKAYFYNSAQVDFQGRGFLGFAEFSVLDQSSNLIADQRFNQQFPLTGTVQEARSILFNGTNILTSQVLSDQVSTYTNVPLAGPRYAVALQTTSTTNTDLCGTALPTSTASYSYDFNRPGGAAYGDLQSSTSSTSDGFSKTTTNTYGDIVNATQWLLGRVTQSVAATTFGGKTITRTSAATYNSSTGLLAQSVSEPNTAGTDSLTVNYGYDGYGNMTSLSSPAQGGTNSTAVDGRSTVTTYDALGLFVTSVTNALNQTTQFTHDARFGGVTKVTDPNLLSSTSAYDGFGRKSQDAAVDGTTLKYSYTSSVAGQNTSAVYEISSASYAVDGVTQVGPSTATYYDVLGRAFIHDTQSFTGTMSRVQLTYDTLGNVVQTSRPFFSPGGTPENTVNQFDILHRLAKSTAPDGTVATHNVCALTSVDQNANSQTLTTVRNSQNWVTAVTDALGNTTTYGYDPAGHQTSVTDVAGNIVTMTYDLRGNLIKKQDPDVGTWTYGYDLFGESTSVIDNKGQVFAATFDLLGRPVSRTEPDLDSSWTYDTAANGIGKLASSSTNEGYALTLSYDTLSRPTVSTQSINGASESFSVAYDPNTGQMASVQYPSGFKITKSYNAYGYVSGQSEADALASSALLTVNTMDAEGHVTQATAGNGIATARRYNPLNGELQSILAGPSNGIQSLTYGYDPIGNITSRADATQSLSESFGYDALNRLTTAQIGSNTATTYGYDPIGNLTSKSDVGTFTYGPSGGQGPHQVQSVNVSSNSPYAAAFAAGTERSYTWTSFNMPATVTQGGKTIAFTYDVNHSRITQSSAEGTTFYVRDPISGAYEDGIQSGTSLIQRNYFAGGVSLWTQVNGGAVSATVRYIHGDHLASTSVLTDASGAVVERDGYDAWGKRRYANGGTDAAGAITSQIDQGYIAQEELPDVSLVHLNARLYDPLVGRFVSADPSGLNGGANVYAYAGNNPIGLSDPTGLDPSANSNDYGTYSDDGSNADSDYSIALNNNIPTGSHLPGGGAGSNCQGCLAGGIYYTGSSDSRYGTSTIDSATGLGTAGLQVSAQLGQNTEVAGMNSEAGVGDGLVLGAGGAVTDAWGNSFTNSALASAQGGSPNGNGVQTLTVGGSVSANNGLQGEADFLQQMNYGGDSVYAMSRADGIAANNMDAAAGALMAIPDLNVLSPLMRLAAVSLFADPIAAEAVSQLAINRAAGAAFEQAVGSDLAESGLTIGQQVTVRTQSGVTTRLDFLTQDPLTGEIGCIECKASPTAPLTGNQSLAFPEIGQSGGTILGAGKPGFPGGMQLPPTIVQIIRRE